MVLFLRFPSISIARLFASRDARSGSLWRVLEYSRAPTVHLSMYREFQTLESLSTTNVRIDEGLWYGVAVGLSLRNSGLGNVLEAGLIEGREGEGGDQGKLNINTYIETGI